MSEEFLREDYFDETIKHMADSMRRSLLRQEAIHAEFMRETRDFNARIDTKLNRFRATVDDIQKIVDDMKHDITRWGIIMAIILSVEQIIIALLFHYLK